MLILNVNCYDEQNITLKIRPNVNLAHAWFFS